MVAHWGNPLWNCHDEGLVETAKMKLPRFCSIEIRQEPHGPHPGPIGQWEGSNPHPTPISFDMMMGMGSRMPKQQANPTSPAVPCGACDGGSGFFGIGGGGIVPPGVGGCGRSGCGGIDFSSNLAANGAEKMVISLCFDMLPSCLGIFGWF